MLTLTYIHIHFLPSYTHTQILINMDYITSQISLKVLNRLQESENGKYVLVAGYKHYYYY